MPRRVWTNQVPYPNKFKGGNSGRWVQLVNVLKTHPGKWTYEVVASPDYMYGTVSAFRRGTLGAINRGDVEAYGRQVDGECRVYLRWVGDES